MNLQEYVDNLEKTDFSKKFNKIPEDLTGDTYMDSTIYSDRNRFSNILTSDKNVIKITTGYINASYILNNKYIATQSPLQRTISHFWTLIYETNSRIIINLSGNNDYLKYKSKFNIEIKDCDYQTPFEIRQIILTCNNEKKTVYHISFNNWIDHQTPSVENFNKLLAIIGAYDSLQNLGPMIIHCKAGVGRTGTFILAHYILEQIKNNIFLDPIQVVMDMRRNRASMVQGIYQFNFAVQYICAKLNFKEKTNSPRKKLSSSCDCSFECFVKETNSLSSSSENLFI